MSNGLTNELLVAFSEFVTNHIGLCFPADRWPDLRQGVRAAASEFGFADEESCMRGLMSSPLSKHQIEILAGELTVGETYFLREVRAFEVLREQIIPELVRARRGGEQKLRLWSAGCCTGEEAYTLAVMMHKAIPDPQNWNVTVLGTDINPRFLRKASVGVFSEWSFRSASPWLKEDYFAPAARNCYEIRQEIRDMVIFEPLNLAEDIYPALLNDTNAMDVIFCRNVLMYFAPEQIEKVIAKLRRSLVDGGWLVLSACEAAHHRPTGFTAVDFEGAMLFRKDGATPFPAAPIPRPSWKTTAAKAPDPPVAQAASEGPQIPTGAKRERTIAAPTFYAQAEALYSRGDYAGASKKLAQLCNGRESGSRSISLLTRCLANQGRLSEALSWSDKAVSAHKLDPSCHYLRAIVLVEQGAVDEARQELRRTLFLDRDFVLAHFALGNLARGRGQVGEAGRHFRNATQCLRKYAPGEVLPESDGINAERLAEIIESTMEEEGLA